MTPEEYKERRETIEKEHKTALTKALKGLNLEYTIDNNTVVEGDFVTDHGVTIKVEKVRHGIQNFMSEPCCVYSGPEYTKKGVPKKNGAYSNVFQCNLVAINGEKIDGRD